MQMASVVTVYGDGRCFFRCLAIYLCKELLEAERTENGLTVSNILRNEQISKADNLRGAFLDLLSKEKEMLSQKSKTLPYILDKGPSSQYTSFNERLEAMSHAGTFAGNVELVAAGLPVFCYECNCMYIKNRGPL